MDPTLLGALVPAQDIVSQEYQGASDIPISDDYMYYDIPDNFGDRKDKCLELNKSDKIPRTPWGRADMVGEKDFLLIAFSFKPIIDPETFEESVKGLDWANVCFIRKALKNLSLIGQYMHKSWLPIQDLVRPQTLKNNMLDQVYEALGITFNDLNERYEKLSAIGEVTDLIKNADDRLRETQKTLKKEYILSVFKPFSENSSSFFSNPDLMKGFWGYFNPDELEGICMSIKDCRKTSGIFTPFNFVTPKTPWGRADAVKITNFLLELSNFNPILDSDTFEENIKGLDWSNVNGIIKDLRNFLLVSPYLHESFHREFFNKMKESRREYIENLEALDKVTDSIKQAINKLEEIQHQLIVKEVLKEFLDHLIDQQ